MKIVFLCGSLEAGRDGVGDYTRSMAAELIKNGYTVALLAINDAFITEVFRGLQSNKGINIPVLRMPSSYNNYNKTKLATAWVNDFNPEWLSLQFVPFAYHKKGLPFKLVRFLQKLGNGRQWHVMFHELWVGMGAHASKKHVFWGGIQRRLIKSMVSELKPEVIHTHTWLYQAQLAKIKIKATLLPLFSNIPRIESPHKSNLYSNAEIRLIFFGSLHPFTDLQSFLNEILNFQKNSELMVSLQFLGRSGPQLHIWQQACDRMRIETKIFGEQDPENISRLLQNAHAGVTTTALPMIQKSGSVAAMQEHGLPVICISGEWLVRGMDSPAPPEGIFKLKANIIESCLRTFIRGAHLNSLTNISERFVENLQANS